MSLSEEEEEEEEEEGRSLFGSWGSFPLADLVVTRVELLVMPLEVPSPKGLSLVAGAPGPITTLAFFLPTPSIE